MSLSLCVNRLRLAAKRREEEEEEEEEEEGEEERVRILGELEELSVREMDDIIQLIIILII